MTDPPLPGAPAGAFTGSGQWPRPDLGSRILAGFEEGWAEARKFLFAPPRPVPGKPFAAALQPTPEVPRGTPMVTAIVLNLNGATLLETLLASLARCNRYPALELIVVDHGSNDDSVRRVEAWMATLPIVLVRCRENHSFSYSCNRAAELAKGEFLLLLNNDIEFTDDVIGRLVAAVQANDGVAGIKLYEGDSGARRDLHHIGVRFKWFPRRRFLGPYNSVALAGDTALAQAPARFPAVTAAMMLCRRDRYLALGGLHEGFAYGYEDIDLCLKFRYGAGLPVVSLNDVSAVHWNGKTRFSQIAEPKHRGWQRYNAELFDRRRGYATRRESARALFTDDGSYWGRHPRIGIFASRPRWAALRIFAATLAGEFGWRVTRVGRDLRGIDLLIVADGDFPAHAARHRHPAMIAAAWHAGAASDDPARYDLLLQIAPDADGARELRRLLDGYFAERHRIAIKGAPAFDGAEAAAIAALLRQGGHRVHIDAPENWDTEDSIRDDVVLLLPGASACAPQRGKINLAHGDWRGPDLVEARLAVAPPPVLVAAMLAEIARFHAVFMPGPEDPPLDARPPLTERGLDGWRAHPDPVRNLLVEISDIATETKYYEA